MKTSDFKLKVIKQQGLFARNWNDTIAKMSDNSISIKANVSNTSVGNLGKVELSLSTFMQICRAMDMPEKIMSGFFDMLYSIEL